MINLEQLRNTLRIRTYSLFKIPLIFFLGPTVLELTDSKAVIKIPLTYRSKNHLGSMYFGSLSVGADLGGGIMAMKHIDKSGRNIALVFKDFKAEFLKRPESDVYFTCTEGQAIAKLVQKTIDTRERQDLAFEVIATCPDKFGQVPVAKFTLTLSLKLKG